MKACRVLVCISVGLLGLIAFVLGIVAKSHGVKVGDEAAFSSDAKTCNHPSSPAALLGVIAGVSILVAQIIANAFGGCVFCCAKKNTTPSTGAKAGAILFLIFSWILTVFSSLFLFAAGMMNSSVYNVKTQAVDQTNTLHVYCPLPNSSPLLVLGGFLALLSATLAIVFYLLATSGSTAGGRPQVEIPPASLLLADIESKPPP